MNQNLASFHEETRLKTLQCYMPGIAKAGKPIKWNQQNASRNEGRGKKTNDQKLKKRNIPNEVLRGIILWKE